MDKGEWGVHIRHCCALHGCKYGDDDCPVENRDVKQDFTCEWCSEDGIKTVDDIERFEKVRENLSNLKWECLEQKSHGNQYIEVDIDLILELMDIAGIDSRY